MTRPSRDLPDIARARLLSQPHGTVGAMPRRRRFTDGDLAAAVASSPNMHRVLAMLGASPNGGNYEAASRRIRALGLPACHLGRPKAVIAASDDEIRNAVEQSRSFAQVLATLGHKPGGRVQAELSVRVRILGLDCSHFSGRSWRRGTRTPVTPAMPLDQVLVDGRFSRTAHLKRRLLAAGLKQPRCEVCGGRRWNGCPIPLELDHVNGRRDDNRLANLRLLCPNCHAQTPTYRGRNIGGRGRYPVDARVPER